MEKWFFNMDDGNVYTEKQVMKSSTPFYRFVALGRCRSKSDAEDVADSRGL